ncbi:hypothetical protein niasHT_002501 [Heterodera trifolii]|uniref:SGNH domain-containing protein n=1 Tax=Heterodera trifolii TaxID=157864 RepID=A0ABD2MA59_9BILA
MSARIAISQREQMQKCQQIKASEMSSPSLFSMVAEHCLFYSVALCLGVVFFLPSIFWPSFFHLKSLLTISVFQSLRFCCVSSRADSKKVCHPPPSVVQLLPLSVPSVRTFLEQIETKDYRNELSPLLNTVEKVKINEMLKNSFTFDLNNVPGESADDFVREINMLEDNKHMKRIYEWIMKGNGTRRVLLSGNSHAQVAWREVAEAFKGDFRWLRIVSVPGCMPLFENAWRTIYGVRCAETVKGMVKMLRKTQPDLLFLIFRWYDDFQPSQNEKINLGEDAEMGAMQSLMDKVQKLVETRIFISAPNLQFDTEISHQLAKRIWQNTPLEGLNKNYSKHLEDNRIHYDRLGRLRCVKCSVFDLAEDFCWEGICHAFEPNTKLAYFSDKNHLSFLGRLKAKKTFEKLAKSVGEKGAEKR